jgi:hypothetical protein
MEDVYVPFFPELPHNEAWKEFPNSIQEWDLKTLEPHSLMVLMMLVISLLVFLMI